MHPWELSTDAKRTLATFKSGPEGYPFAPYSPTPWSLEEGDRSKTIYSVRRTHGLKGRIHYHTLEDDINCGRPDLDKLLLTYELEGVVHPLFTLEDLYWARPSDSGNIRRMRGELGERISRRVVKRFLRKHPNVGNGGGLFGNDFLRSEPEGYIVAESENYALKLKNYPNLVVVDKKKHVEIKELDGLFDYKHNKRQHIMVLETKTGFYDLDLDKVVLDLFVPLRELYPDSALSLIMFGNEDDLLQREWREVRRMPVLSTQQGVLPSPFQIYETLASAGIHTLLLTFQETKEDFQRMTDHLMTEFEAVQESMYDVVGRVTMLPTGMVIRNKQGKVQMRFARDATGALREIPLET